MSALLSWLFLLGAFLLALWLAGGFSRWLDGSIDRMRHDDLEMVRRRDAALDVMRKWTEERKPYAPDDEEE